VARNAAEHSRNGILEASHASNLTWIKNPARLFQASEIKHSAALHVDKLSFHINEI
jgi:hypothetical protein